MSGITPDKLDPTWKTITPVKLEQPDAQTSAQHSVPALQEPLLTSILWLDTSCYDKPTVILFPKIVIFIWYKSVRNLNGARTHVGPTNNYATTHYCALTVLWLRMTSRTLSWAFRNVQQQKAGQFHVLQVFWTCCISRVCTEHPKIIIVLCRFGPQDVHRREIEVIEIDLSIRMTGNDFLI